MGDAEEINDICSQDGVLLIQAKSTYMSFMNCIGTIYINETRAEPHEKFLEWKPNDVTVDSEIQDQEWAVVNTVQKRTRTISGSLPLDYHNRLKSLRTPLKDICSFKVANKNRQLKFYDGKGDLICTFLFQTNCDFIVGKFKEFFTTSPSRRDRNLFYVQEQNTPEYQQLTRSFAELNLPDDYGMWKLLNNFKQQPVEATLEAFSKVTTIGENLLIHCASLLCINDKFIFFSYLFLNYKI